MTNADDYDENSGRSTEPPTIDQAKEDREFREAMPLLGAIMGQMSRDREWTENQLQGMMEHRVLELRRDFVQLYNALLKVAERTDSWTAVQALDRFEWKYNDALKGIEDAKGSF